MNYDVTPLLPTIIFSIGAMIALTVSLFDRSERGAGAGWVAVLTAAAGILVIAATWKIGVVSFDGMLVGDGIGRFFCLLSCVIVLLTSLTSIGVIGKWRTLEGEYHALILLGGAGMCVMAVSTHLLVIFFGIEVLSLGLYALAGYRHRHQAGVEAAMKYFLLGSVASAVLLYGISLIYGATGGLRLEHLAAGAASASQSPSLLFYTGVAMLIVGFGFKAAVAPFHMWVPDVYQGAPTPVTGFMATGVKAAAFAVLLRVFPDGLAAIASDWTQVFAVLAVLTMVIGNVMALSQRDVKRMLAYSSVAHAGYLLVALVAAGSAGESALGRESILFYTAVYALTNLGAFAALCVFGPGREDDTDIDHYAGFARRRPWVAAAMAIFLFSLAGIPPFAGFASKFYVFYAAVATGHTALAIVGVLTSVLSVYYYLKVIVAMYMKEPADSHEMAALPASVALVIGVCILAVIGMGVLPGWWMDVAKAAVAQ